MPRSYSLTGEEIRNLSGKRLHGRFFSLLVAPLPGKHAKCACVVSKKVAREAPKRNLIKRRSRAVCSTKVKSIQKPIALVLYAKKGVDAASFVDIRADITDLFEKVS